MKYFIPLEKILKRMSAVFLIPLSRNHAMVTMESEVGSKLTNPNYNRRAGYLTAKRHSKDGKTEGRNICT